MMTETNPDLCMLAIVNAVPGNVLKVARGNTSPGRYNVDFLARIKGSINVAQDGFTTQSTSVDYKTAFVKAMELLQRKTGIVDDVLHDAIRSLLSDKTDADGTLSKIVADTEKSVTRVTGKSPRKGAVTTKLSFELVDPMKHDPLQLALTGALAPAEIAELV